MKNSEIISYLNDKAFARKTCLQLIKEFDYIGIALPLDPDCNDQNKIEQIIAEELTSISSQRSELFAQLLYRVDIPEQGVKKTIATSNEVMSDLAHAFLIRVAQKIYLRERFS